MALVSMENEMVLWHKPTFVSGDNLGSNFIDGYKESASAHRNCWQYMGNEKDCKF